MRTIYMYDDGISAISDEQAEEYDRLVFRYCRNRFEKGPIRDGRAFLCTREMGHTEIHVAHSADGLVLAVWD